MRNTLFFFYQKKGGGNQLCNYIVLYKKTAFGFNFGPKKCMKVKVIVFQIGHFLRFKIESENSFFFNSLEKEEKKLNKIKI